MNIAHHLFKIGQRVHLFALKRPFKQVAIASEVFICSARVAVEPIRQLIRDIIFRRAHAFFTTNVLVKQSRHQFLRRPHAEQHVKMIRQQAIRVKLGHRIHKTGKPHQEQAVVPVSKKNILPVVAPVKHMINMIGLQRPKRMIRHKKRLR